MSVQIIKPYNPFSPAVFDHLSQIFHIWIRFQFVQKVVKILFLKDNFRIVGFLDYLLFGYVHKPVKILVQG